MTASNDIEQAFSKAIALHQQGELAQAENLYRQILARIPEHLDCLNLLGMVAIQTGRSQLAVELIGKAITLNDKVADFHNNIGEAFRRLGDLDLAAGHFARAADLEPTFLEAQQNLGDVGSACARTISGKIPGRLGADKPRKLARFRTGKSRHIRRDVSVLDSKAALTRCGSGLRR